MEAVTLPLLLLPMQRHSARRGELAIEAIDRGCAADYPYLNQCSLEHGLRCAHDALLPYSPCCSLCEMVVMKEEPGRESRRSKSQECQESLGPADLPFVSASIWLKDV